MRRSDLGKGASRQPSKCKGPEVGGKARKPLWLERESEEVRSGGMGVRALWADKRTLALTLREAVAMGGR